MTDETRDALDKFYSATRAGGRARALNVNAGGEAWPVYSDSMGCHPSQVEEFRAHSKEVGVPTDFDKKGCAIFTSEQHMRDYCRATGYANKNGSRRVKRDTKPIYFVGK